MSLATPEKIRIFQRKLYRKAKAQSEYRFYLLYDKICRENILRHAYDLARANAGAPGGDGVTSAVLRSVMSPGTTRTWSSLVGLIDRAVATTP